VDEDPAAGTTTLGWDEGLGALARPWRAAIDPAANPEVWVFRASASLFGYNAPDYRLLDPAVAERISPDDWNTARLPEDEDHPERIYLDAVHPGVEPDGWIALVTTGDALLAPDQAGVAAGRHEPYVELYPVLEVAEASRLGYTLSATVTRVTVDTTVRDGIREPENIRRFPLRTTTVLIRSERLELAEVPISQPLAGDVIELVGHHPDLHRRRRLVVTGELAGGTETATAVETVEIAQVTHEGPPGAAHTTITLANPLVNAYDPASVLIFGNVARASHGETVADEVLGDGDAAQEFQTFELRKGPLTYVGQPGAPGGVASTVELRVDDVRWEEVTDLHGLASDRRAYVVRRRPDATALMGFGDGRTAARLVSGRGNVTATYRVGLGPEGNVSAGALRTLLRKPLGLRGATNLAPAFGGTAAEPPAAVKATAPGTVRTFGRIVSLGDAEDAAREFIGIAKARATRAWDGERQVVDLVVAADGGGPTAPLLPDLQADLDARRDRHQSLRLREVRRLPIRVGLAVAIDRAHEVETVRAAAEAALRALLAFDALDIGQSVHLSDIHRAVQAVPGVVAVDVDELRFARPEDRLRRGGEAVAQPRLLVGPDEIASVEELDALRVTASFVKDAGT